MSAPTYQNVLKPGSGQGSLGFESDAVVVVHGLRKTYLGAKAAQGIDLTVRTGEIFAFLGPNGAGKTTTVETLEGYRNTQSVFFTLLLPVLFLVVFGLIFRSATVRVPGGLMSVASTPPSRSCWRPCFRSASSPAYS